ncbi:MAG: hypothetical protein M0Z39_00390 [Actinomycetota bacterium]|nr:hypothetical protein [Actinomycetota bacterium]
MMLLQPSEPLAVEFEGRSPEQAVARARKVLGYEVELRCWKARKGGIFGFFARETFFAGLTSPESVSKEAKSGAKASSLDVTKERSAAEDDWAAQLLKYAERTTLLDLVEQTSDPVTLGSALVHDAVFSDVLSEAEATLGRIGLIDVGVAEKTMPAKDPYEIVFPKPQIIGGLREGLARIGLAAVYQPPESEASLDGLFRSLAALPAARAIPNAGGSTIVVVGGTDDALEAARGVVKTLGTESCEPLALERSDSARLQVVFRQCAKKLSVVVVEAPVGSRALAEAVDWIEQLRPDYILGSVPATAKRSDIIRWCDRIGHVDSLAVSSLGETATPGEVLGEIPIAFIDGAPATTLRWVNVLLGALLES